MERDCNPRARCICTAAGFAAFVPWPKENKVLASFPVDKGDAQAEVEQYSTDVAEIDNIFVCPGGDGACGHGGKYIQSYYLYHTQACINSL